MFNREGAKRHWDGQADIFLRGGQQAGRSIKKSGIISYEVTSCKTNV